MHSYLFPDFYTCDFDLIDPKEQWRRYHFSDDCLSIYKRRQYSDTYYLYLAEAHAFKKFTMAIENYEAKKSGKKMCANNEVSVIGVLIYLCTSTHALEGTSLLRKRFQFV